jgi:uncharacterized protein (TIGR02246 family)
MKKIRSTVRRTFLAAMLWFAIAVAVNVVHSGDAYGLTLPASDSAAAVKIVDDFVRVWNAHDMNAFGALFTEDADFVNVVGIWMKGREEIVRLHTERHEMVFKTSVLTAIASDLDVLCSDVAVMHMTWTLSGHLGPDMKPALEPRNGVLTLVAVRGKDRWLIHSGQNTDIVAKTSASPVTK